MNTGNKEQKEKEIVDITTSMYWWLRMGRPFIINNEYKIEVFEIRKSRSSMKIKITNLKNNSTSTVKID